VWIAQDRDPWGPSIARLIQELPEQHHSQFDELRDAALYLDKLYIPTRYPDALADLIPSEAYTEGEAEQACRHAHELVSRVETWLDQHGPE
jgi:HEPN domain-containing protein